MRNGVSVFVLIFLVANLTMGWQAHLGSATWNGLRFGMSEQEAKNVLKERAGPPGENEKSLSAEFYTPWVVHDLNIGGFDAKAMLVFDSKMRSLSKVVMDLRSPFHAETNWMPSALERVRQDLSKSYGVPISAEKCEGTACITTWKLKGQIITLHVVGRGALVMIAYDPGL